MLFVPASPESVIPGRPKKSTGSTFTRLIPSHPNLIRWTRPAGNAISLQVVTPPGFTGVTVPGFAGTPNEPALLKEALNNLSL